MNLFNGNLMKHLARNLFLAATCCFTHSFEPVIGFNRNIYPEVYKLSHLGNFLGALLKVSKQRLNSFNAGVWSLVIFNFYDRRHWNISKY
jgi:hypothetical protein